VPADVGRPDGSDEEIARRVGNGQTSALMIASDNMCATRREPESRNVQYSRDVGRAGIVRGPKGRGRFLTLPEGPWGAEMGAVRVPRAEIRLVGHGMSSETV
jgi:hypothetical protein